MAAQPLRLAPRFLAARFGAPIGIACAAAAVLASLFALAFSTSAALAALLAGAAAITGVATGLLVLIAIAASPHSEPAVALLFASVVRLLAAAGIGLALQTAFDLQTSPFWFAFLFNFVIVLGAEVAATRRLFPTEPPTSQGPQGSPRP
jgi:hypothetical protein